MARQGVDHLLVTPSSDFYYLTGLPIKASERITGLLLSADGKARLVLPHFELARVGPDLRDAAEVHTWEETDDPLGVIAGLTGSRAPKVAVSDQTWSVFLVGLIGRLPGAAWVSGAAVLTPLRMVKDETEIRLLREAQEKAEAALGALLARGLTGKTERQVAADLVKLRQEAGLDTSGSAGIVGSGPNGASPHHLNGDRVIRKGDAVVIDFGGGHQGYRADITRTPHVGPPSAEFTEVYETVRRANAAAFAAIRPGVACAAIDAAGRRVIDDAGYGAYFTHRLGHGIGLDGHEEPYIVAGNATAVRVGTTFSDEPGVYLPDKFGVRIEDIVRVTESGAESLTTFPREIQVVD
jgi:Xaa-Pro aminopeptidase